TAVNRGPDPATLHLLPTLWFRNLWSWGYDDRRPLLTAAPTAARSALRAVHAHHHLLGDYAFCCESADDLLFTQNETNTQRLFGTSSPTPYVKDAFDQYLVHANRPAVNPERHGTKAAAWYERTIPSGGSTAIRLRLQRWPAPGQPPRLSFDD